MCLLLMVKVNSSSGTTYCQQRIWIHLNEVVRDASDQSQNGEDFHGLRAS